MNSNEIAKLAGVSRSTVSRVINNYPNVPEETRKKVLKVIDEYDYVPHASARMLAGVKNRIIGLFIIDMAERSGGIKNRITRSPYYLEFTSSVISVFALALFNFSRILSKIMIVPLIEYPTIVSIHAINVVPTDTLASA